jgi:hypothetical protein
MRIEPGLFASLNASDDIGIVRFLLAICHQDIETYVAGKNAQGNCSAK